MAKTARTTISCGFGSLMDIDKLIPRCATPFPTACFGSLMDIDKLILNGSGMRICNKFWFSDGY